MMVVTMTAASMRDRRDARRKDRKDRRTDDDDKYDPSDLPGSDKETYAREVGEGLEGWEAEEADERRADDAATDDPAQPEPLTSDDARPRRRDRRDDRRRDAESREKDELISTSCIRRSAAKGLPRRWSRKARATIAGGCSRRS
jgi:hypothetical protein